MTIYEIDAELEQIYATAIDPDTGELNDAEAWSRIDDLQKARDEKIESVALWWKNTEAESKAIAAEIANLEKRKKVADRKAEWQKSYLMDVLNGEKFTTPKVAISFRNNRSVYIEDSEMFCDRYRDSELVRCKTTYSPDKTAIKKYIEDGNTVDGAEIVNSVSMSIR